jgi:hypothetical protein
MARSRLLFWLLVTVAVVFVGAALVSVAIMAFVFSVGTAVVTLDVPVTVREKATGRPIAGCLLAFERNQTSGWGQTSERTNAEGRSRQEVSYSYVGSFFMPWDRDRTPVLKFYLGGAPRYDTQDEVETWIVHLPFDEPWFGNRVNPTTRVERAIFFEDTKIDGKLRQAGARPLPAGDAGLGPVEIILSRDASGRPVYQIPLEISLDATQIASCTRGIEITASKGFTGRGIHPQGRFIPM